jgi:hypothetical protein
MEIDLSIKSIIIDNLHIGNDGMQILCSQPLSHVVKLFLCKNINSKLEMISERRECYTSLRPIGET